jgi:hypothetical protein
MYIKDVINYFKNTLSQWIEKRFMAVLSIIILLQGAKRRNCMPFTAEGCIYSGLQSPKFAKHCSKEF